MTLAVTHNMCYRVDCKILNQAVQRSDFGTLQFYWEGGLPPVMLLCTGDGSNLWRIANAVGCEYIEKKEETPMLLIWAAQGQQQ